MNKRLNNTYTYTKLNDDEFVYVQRTCYEAKVTMDLALLSCHDLVLYTLICIM